MGTDISDKWLSRVIENVFPLSREKEDIKKALQEWIYRGAMIDLGEPSETCQLCEYQPIRYQFEIKNEFTQSNLWIGSECITKFVGGIRVVDATGRVLDDKDAKKKVQSDRNQLIKEAHFNSVRASLRVLYKRDKKTDVEGLFKYYEKRGFFTPKQVLLLIHQMKRHKIDHDPYAFKVVIRRDREKRQLLEMAKEELKEIWPCLSKSQKIFVTDHWS